MPSTRTNKKLETSPASRRKMAYCAGGIAAVLLFLGAGWLVWASLPDPQLAEIKALQQQMFDPNSGLDDNARRELRQNIRDKMDGLTDAQREQLRDQFFEGFRQRDNERMRNYFAASPEQRIALLDQDIERMRNWEQNRGDRQRNAGGEGGPPGGRGFGGPGGGGPGAGGPGGRGGRDPNESPEDRRDRQRRRLDNSTSEERAMRSAYFEDLNKRRVQLGLEPIPPRRGRG